MRTEKLKPNTEYATEAGSLVVTGADRPERGWYSWREGSRKGDLKFGRELPGGAPSNDPWGPPRRGAQDVTRTGDGTILYEVREGVLVDRYKWDRQGLRVGEPTQAVIDPKHIPGTWADYVLLHGDLIEAHFRWDDAWAEAREESKRLKALAGAAGIPAEGSSVLIMVDIVWTVKDRNGATSEQNHLSKGKPFESYRLVPEIRYRGDWAESTLDALISAGH